jgi:hypothetical protein
MKTEIKYNMKHICLEIGYWTWSLLQWVWSLPMVESPKCLLSVGPLALTYGYVCVGTLE